MDWNKVWIFPFYLVDFVVFVAVLFCLIYFLKYRRSPLVKASHSKVDNVILIILCLFCLLPIIHFGEISSAKCLFQWLVQNVMYATYCGLLFTKRPYFRNTRAGRRIACEQAHHMIHINEQQSPALRTRQEHIYPALFVMLPVVITMATVPFSVNHEVNIPACPSRVDLCPIQGNSSVFTSMAYTWSLLLSLSVLALTENNGGQKSWKIPWVILVGFLSYTALVCYSYLKLQCSWFNFVVYLLILINPVLCLITLYLPKWHLITTCSLHLKRFRKSSGSMRKGSRYHESSTGEVIVNCSLPAGSHEGSNTRLHAGLHASTDLASARPASSASDTSRILNIQKSIQIVSNLFRAKEPGYQLLRQHSLYDNVPEPVITCDNISQSSVAISLDVDGQSIGESEGSFELAEITFEELREMTEFLKGLRSSDV